MIKMKALRTFGYAGVNEGAVTRGREFNVRDERRARELEAEGLAYPLPAKAAVRPLNKMEAAPQNQIEPPPENKAERDGPLPEAGGATGETTAPLSLLPDHPRPKRRSRGSRESRES